MNWEYNGKSIVVNSIGDIKRSAAFKKWRKGLPSASTYVRLGYETSRLGYRLQGIVYFHSTLTPLDMGMLDEHPSHLGIKPATKVPGVSLAIAPGKGKARKVTTVIDFDSYDFDTKVMASE